MNDSNKNKFDKSFKTTTYNYLLYQLYCFSMIYIICSLFSEYDIEYLSYLLSFVLPQMSIQPIKKTNVFDYLSSMRLFIVHCNFLIEIRNTEKVNKDVLFMSE